MTDKWMRDDSYGDSVHLWDKSCCGESYTKCASVVVIDPDDREQVQQFTEAYFEAFWASPGVGEVRSPGSNDRAPERIHRTAMSTALRSLNAPPKPPEPTGLGAVVEDAKGQCWINAPGATSGPWFLAGGPGTRTYNDIAAVKVLSEGVTP